MALLNPCMKVPSVNFIQKTSHAPSKCLSEKINWIISRIPYRISKNTFVYGSYESFSHARKQIQKKPFLLGFNLVKLQYDHSHLCIFFSTRGHPHICRPWAKARRAIREFARSTPGPQFTKDKMLKLSLFQRSRFWQLNRYSKNVFLLKYIA